MPYITSLSEDAKAAEFRAMALRECERAAIRVVAGISDPFKP